ncbi:MAG TPA: SpoIIE family protein phosphatase [Lacipirellulaceae bacterium]|jgi:serine phosphatase RsbU (regulator of sigma subunit)|nr:SpoIIE family protein phosphatase [Lacipirellulaceae bacterium]
MAILELVKGNTPGVRFELDADRSVIGRSADCEVPLDVPAVSRRHAVILRDSGRYFIEDLQSRNGTFLNDNRLTERAPLGEGDRLIICDQEFRFYTAQTPALLNPLRNLEESSITDIVDDRSSSGRGSVMATLDVSGGSASWGLSAKPEVKLAALMEITNGLAHAVSVEDILPKLLESLFKIFTQADRGFVVMKPKADGPPVVVADKSRRPGSEERMRISRTIVEEAMKNKKAILSADAASDERFGMAQSIADFSIRSMICAPMIGLDGQPLGVIQIDTLNQRARFTDQDLEVLATVASQAAVSIDNAKMHEQVAAQRAMQRDLELARRMQRSLLPSAPPQVPGYFFFDYYQAARQVGGDYYDYVQLPGGRYAVIVGDVAGKGVPAALLMARLSADVRFSLASEPDPAKAIQRINDGFAKQDWQDRFVTMLAAVLNPAASELTIVNAGHMAPLLRRQDGHVTEIGEDAAGLPLGVVEGFEYESFTHKVEPGDVLTIFTDGFSEAMNNERELYGIERLKQQLNSPAVSLVDFGQHILEDVHKFVDGFDQSDDMCLVCFGRVDA